MIFYIKLGVFCAASVEISRVLSAKPLIAKQCHKDETIIDLPFCRIIYTPRRRLAQEKDADHGKEHDNDAKAEPANIHHASKEAAEG
jgi:hypothetical protein